MNIYYIISLILFNVAWIIYMKHVEDVWIERTKMLLKMDQDEHREIQKLFFKEFPWEEDT